MTMYFTNHNKTEMFTHTAGSDTVQYNLKSLMCKNQPDLSENWLKYYKTKIQQVEFNAYLLEAIGNWLVVNELSNIQVALCSDYTFSFFNGGIKVATYVDPVLICRHLLLYRAPTIAECAAPLEEEMRTFTNLTPYARKVRNLLDAIKRGK